MTDLILTIGGERFVSRLQQERAPKTCARFLTMLPFRRRIIHARWSGEACWVPMGNFDFGVEPENATHDPRPGELILYPGGISETELLLAYGTTRFACKAGPLAGTPVLLVKEGLDRLATLGQHILWTGACDFAVETHRGARSAAPEARCDLAPRA